MENFKIKNLLVNVHPQTGSVHSGHAAFRYDDAAEGLTKCIQPSRSILRTVNDKCTQPAKRIEDNQMRAGIPTLADLKQAIAALQQHDN